MITCTLRWSRIEFAFLTCCHLVAAMSLWQASVLLALKVLASGWLAWSFQRYLRDRIQTFYGGAVAGAARLMLAPQFARIDYRGRLLEMRPPRLRYLSEFLLVLSFRAAGSETKQSLALVLWPDSLQSSDDRRLRRYLRFDLRAGMPAD